MKIETIRSRDTPETILDQNGLKIQKSSLGVSNLYRIKAMKKKGIVSDRDKREFKLKRRLVRVPSQRIKTSAKTDIGSLGGNTRPELLSYVQSQGTIRTAVKWRNNGSGRIQTAVNREIATLPEKDTHMISDAAKRTADGAVKKTISSIVNTGSENNAAADTGTESVKMAVRDIKIADKARQTIRSKTKSGIQNFRNIKRSKADIKADVRKIREKIIRRRKSKKAGIIHKLTTASESDNRRISSKIRSIVMSKGFIVIVGGAVGLLVFLTILSGVIIMILSTISSTLSWLFPKDSSESKEEHLKSYIETVEEIQADIQTSLDEEFSYTPEYRYDGSEITALKQYGNTTLAVDEAAVISAAAVIEYGKESDEVEYDTLESVMESFYSSTRSTHNGYCPGHDCKRDENVELKISDSDFSVTGRTYEGSSDSYLVTFRGNCNEHTSSVDIDIKIAMDDGAITGNSYACISGSNWDDTFRIGSAGYSKIDWNDITIKATTIYCNDPDHTYYTGEVINYDIETALDNLDFTEDQRELFWMYYDCVKEGGI